MRVPSTIPLRRFRWARRLSLPLGLPFAEHLHVDDRNVSPTVLVL